MARTKEEIKRQIEGLKKDREFLPRFSKFGTRNWEKIDVMIDVLSGDIEDEDKEELWEDDGSENELYYAAEQAEMWLDKDSDDDLFFNDQTP